MSAVRIAVAVGNQVRASSSTSPALLTVATLFCLLPFSGRAFNIDEPLFIWTAQHIIQHPLDPYGFSLNWGFTQERMAEVTQNPPLACYYAAVVGRIAGWSERALHVGFLLPALVVIIGTYYLARRFTRLPLLAAAATLLSPGFLVSSSAVMCDTLMLAFWILAVILWLEGLDGQKPLYFIASAFLIAACALTKYIGVSLIFLLLAYSMWRRRRLEHWAWYMLIPVFILIGYQLWTKSLYGQGLLLAAAEFAKFYREQSSESVKAVIGLSFAGGCTLPALTLAPLLWSRSQIVRVSIGATIAGLCLGAGWVSLGPSVHALTLQHALHHHWPSVSVQLALCVAAGVFVIMLAALDFWKRRDAPAVFLMLWVLGTFVFAAFVNWTVNARSVLPLIPAVGILLARRVQDVGRMSEQWFRLKLILALAVSGIVSLWVTSADAALANSARTAVNLIHNRIQNEAGTVWFDGHWGFQYYMESYGALPVDFKKNSTFNPGDFVVVAENNTGMTKMLPEFVAQQEVVEIKMRRRITTTCQKLGAGFYSALSGALPFVVGRVPPERYHLFQVTLTASANQYKPIPVSMVQLIVYPERFDDTRVTVTGFLTLERAKNGVATGFLYLHQEDAKHLLVSNATQVIPNEEMLQNREKIDGIYITITGLFRVIPVPGGPPILVIKDVQSCIRQSDPTTTISLEARTAKSPIHR